MELQMTQEQNSANSTAGLGELLARLQEIGYDVQLSPGTGEPKMVGEPAVRLAQWLHNAQTRG